MDQNLLHRFAIGRVSRFISNSEEGRQFLLTQYGVPAQQIRVIRNGVKLADAVEDRNGWHDRLKLQNGQLVAVMVANLSSYKDHLTLIKAWKRLIDSCNGPLPLLVLAGRFDDMADQLQQQVRQLGIAANVRFLGSEPDVAGLLLAADVAVHSSYSEGIPNAVLEAMSAGLAVVATDILGLREAVGEEGADYLVPPGNDQALAASLKMMFADPALRQRQGALMQKRAQKLFALDAMCSETAAYLVASMETAS
jgi:glycosyltransferase involved in cell wall biosynthesis